MGRECKIGFIGCGNMGSAMVKGILSAGKVIPSELIVSKKTANKTDELKALGVTVISDNAEVAKKSDVIVLAVKPYQLDEVYGEIREYIKADQIIVSIAAGVSLSSVEQALMSMEVAGKIKVVRAMPNTPAQVGEAMTALSVNANITEEDERLILSYFNSFGKAEIVPESLMDVVTGLSGSSPAFVYMFMEAMADAAVAEGMTRSQAYKFVGQTLRGAATMLLETGKHPGELKDAVCSPGGTTIEGVCTLEAAGFRAAVVDGVTASIEKSREMSK